MLPKYAIDHKNIVWFLLLALTFGGLYSYGTLGRLEDPEFSLKTALVITIYPGADAKEVEENVTDVIETGIYRLKNVEKLRSYSKPGMSVVYVDLFESTKTEDLTLCWNELRNKMKEIQRDLPPEALEPIVKDDFSQVYGIVLALTAEAGISNADHLDAAKKLQRQFRLLGEVGRCELWGTPNEAIEIGISRARIQELAVPPAMIFTTIFAQNLSLPAGSMDVLGDSIRLAPHGKFQSVKSIGELEIVGSGTASATHILQGVVGKTAPSAGVSTLSNQTAQTVTGTAIGGTVPSIKLKDIATIRRVKADPPSEVCRFNGKNAIAIAVAPKANGNVIRMGEQVQRCADGVMATLPLGFALEQVAYQPDNVTQSIHVFMKNLYEAVAIVMVVVMIALGIRSGLIISFSLIVTILATICFLKPMGIVLQRVSLAAFIIALGILVDNAVVVGDLITVRMQRGMDRKQACIEGTQRTAKQLFWASVVGALAFLPVYLIPINVGEYCGSLFVVVGLSLMISWVFAMIQPPVFYHQFMFMKTDNVKDPHAGRLFQLYRGTLVWTLNHRFFCLAFICLLCVGSYFGFRHIEQSFFPRAQRCQFMIDYRLSEGASIHSVADDLKAVENWLVQQGGVRSTATFIGGGPPRFYLLYEPEFPNSAYGQIIVNVNQIDDVERLLDPVEHYLKETYPQAQIRVQKFALGTPTYHEIEARFRGPDSEVLRKLGLQAEKILRESPWAKTIDNNWRQKVLTLSPQYSQTKGRRAGLSRMSMNLSLLCSSRGIPVGVYSENEKNIPILVRGSSDERNNIVDSGNIPVWGLTTEVSPLGELISSMKYVWENAEIYRYNRVPAVIVGAESNHCVWTKTLQDVRPKMETIPLPEGYTLDWGGQQEESVKSTSNVLAWLPISCLMMLTILIFLFNDFRQPLIIALSIPLAMIGITIGMLMMNKVFGFMALLGIMGLLGMLIRNGVVLMDQIDEEIAIAKKNNGSPFEAVVTASLERMRPVVVAAMTVIVGMIPLLKDPMFDSMATAMMFGLMFATVLTLYVVPVLYTFFFGIKPEKA
ncbi:MAG: efflux RND transporter permease subunit [Thermoguttaceae bacterium]|nr:efflux RND transporter permease subunit [Thermoguttaceae bacterium]